MDTSPIGEETRAKWDKARQDEELRQRNIESLDLLRNQRIKIRDARIVNDTPEHVGKVYRTQGRRTTRPNMSGAIADDAEAHDVQNKRIIATEAGPVALNLGSQSQRGAKYARKVARAKADAEKKAAEDANIGRKGNVQQIPTNPTVGKGKGKEKELRTSRRMLRWRRSYRRIPRGKEGAGGH